MDDPKPRKFKVIIGDDSWVITAMQRPNDGKASCLVELLDQNLPYAKLRQKLEEASDLKKALSVIRGSDIITDQLPPNLRRSLIVSASCPSDMDYGALIEAQLRPFHPTELPFDPSRASTKG